jgi:glycopeptide antibiotics resistance protein
MFSVVDVMVAFFLFLPLGALLAVWPIRLRGSLRGFLPALYFAGAVELSQTMVLGRTVDITDFLVQAAGVGIGWAIVRRAGFRPYGEQLSRKR